MWHFQETGSGRPLILLHGIGMSQAAWNPVLPYLRATRRVIAFDVAGFGSTPPLPPGVPPTVTNLVDALEASVAQLDLETPVDIVGNSLGGCLALESARRGLARTVVAISPAGLWRNGPPAHLPYVFTSMLWASRHARRLVTTAMRAALLRELVLAVPLSAGSRRMPAADAIRAIEDLARSAAFEETFEETRSPFSGLDITVPITIAFGTRDRILPAYSRYRDRLPRQTRWIDKPEWGHVPMWIDPSGVAALILEGTRRVGTRDPVGEPAPQAFADEVRS